MSRELLKQALDALIYHTGQTRPIARTDSAITALRSELAQPAPEPVAVITECMVNGQQTVTEIDGRWKFLRGGDFLYATPQQAQTAPAPVVPADMVIVPREPFPSQRIAGVVALIRASQRDFEPTTDEIAAVYRAMIAAAPAMQPLQSQLDEARADADRRHQLPIIQHAEAVELWSALKDLSFECDGVTRCIAPSRETYNRTFAILQRKNHLSSEALRGHGSSGLQQQQQAHGIAAPGSKP